MKQRFLFLMLILIFSISNTFSQSGTYDFYTGATQDGQSISQTVSSVTLTIYSDHSTTPYPSMTLQDWSAYPPFTDNAATMNGQAKTSCTFSFSSAVNLKSILVADFAGTTNYNLLFTPNVGASYHQVIDGSNGSVVTLNFSHITSFVITNNAGGTVDLGFDNVIMTNVNNVTSLAVGSITTNQIPLSWTNASGSSGVIVLAKASSAVQTTVPTVGYSSIPSANSNFTSAPDASTAGFGSSGDKLVYKGTGTSITTTNLTNGTTYYFKVFNWDGSFWSSGVTTSGSQALPVELTSFLVSTNNNTVTLNWATATEVNNYGFEVERRVVRTDLSQPSPQRGGQGWGQIGFVQGNGTSNIAHSYSYADASVSSGTYAYRLKQIDNDGTFKYSSEAQATIVAPKKFSLNQNFPNPFNPTTTISYNLPQHSNVKIAVYDIMGREVATLVNETKDAGSYQTVWNANRFASGMYFYKLTAHQTDGGQAGNYTSVKKLVLLK